MKNIIKKEALEWFENVENHNNESLEDFVELVMDKTTDLLFEEIKKQFKDEFLSGNLKHNFVISPDYFIELKLKAAKENFSRSSSTDQQC
jgi:hypothetical protein